MTERRERLPINAQYPNSAALDKVGVPFDNPVRLEDVPGDISTINIEELIEARSTKQLAKYAGALRVAIEAQVANLPETEIRGGLFGSQPNNTIFRNGQLRLHDLPRGEKNAYIELAMSSIPHSFLDGEITSLSREEIAVLGRLVKTRDQKEGFNVFGEEIGEERARLIATLQEYPIAYSLFRTYPKAVFAEGKQLSIGF